MKCNSCKNYLSELDSCLFCSYQKREEDSSSFDILGFDVNYDTHIIIQEYLMSRGVDCLTVDIWFDSDLMIVIGCNTYGSRLAEVLGVHREVVYDWSDNGLFIVNLFQEKYLRGDLE